MASNPILIDLVIIFMVAVPIVLAVHRLHIPPVVGFLVTGALIGPFGLNWINDVHEIELLAEIGIALLLFTVGMEFSVNSLSRIRNIAIWGGLLQIAAVIAITFLCIPLLNFDWYLSLFFGCVIALSSTAVVLHALQNWRWLDSPFGRVSTGILLVQDLSVIIMMLILPWLGQGHLDPNFSWQNFMFKIGGLIVLFWFFARFVVNHLLENVAKTASKELFVTTIIGIAFGYSWLASSAGLSFAIGAFFAGISIGITPYNHHAVSEISPFRSTFGALFFVSMGMLFKVNFALEHWLLLLVLLLIIPFIKSMLTTGILLLLKFPFKSSFATGMILSHLGEFSFLLAQVGLDLQLVNEETYHLIIALTVLTLMITPIMIRIAPAVSEWLTELPGFPTWLLHYEWETESHRPLQDHVIICGFGPLGETIGSLLNEIKVPFVVLELNPITAQRLQQQNCPVYIGDGANSNLLEICQIREAKAIAITAPDYTNSVAIIRRARSLNPEIKIITRARYRSQVEDLYAVGADVVISEELESGIEMGRYLLSYFGMTSQEVSENIDRIRAFGSADFF